MPKTPRRVEATPVTADNIIAYHEQKTSPCPLCLNPEMDREVEDAWVSPAGVSVRSIHEFLNQEAGVKISRQRLTNHIYRSSGEHRHS